MAICAYVRLYEASHGIHFAMHNLGLGSQPIAITMRSDSSPNDPRRFAHAEDVAPLQFGAA